MQCPICQSETKVTNSRSSDRGKAVKRRRVCTECERRFTTYERLELMGFEVIKRDGSKEPYQKEKLKIGIRIALEKRSCSDEEFQQLLSGIERDIFQIGTEVVSSEKIGQIALAHLRRVDKVAYLRFASVHRNFKSPKAFEREIQKLIKK